MKPPLLPKPALKRTIKMLYAGEPKAREARQVLEQQRDGLLALMDKGRLRRYEQKLLLLTMLAAVGDETVRQESRSSLRQLAMEFPSKRPELNWPGLLDDTKVFMGDGGSATSLSARIMGLVVQAGEEGMRGAAGWSQEELGACCDGSREPTAEEIRRLSIWLEISTDWLLLGDESHSHSSTMPIQRVESAIQRGDTAESASGEPSGPSAAPKGPDLELAEIRQAIAAMAADHPRGKAGVADVLGVPAGSMRWFLNSSRLTAYPHTIINAWRRYQASVADLVEASNPGSPEPEGGPAA